MFDKLLGLAARNLIERVTEILCSPTPQLPLAGKSINCILLKLIFVSLKKILKRKETVEWQSCRSYGSSTTFMERLILDGHWFLLPHPVMS